MRKRRNSKDNDSVLRKQAIDLVYILKDKKALRPIILNVSELTNLCSFFVICSADNTKQVRALYEEVIEKSASIGLKVHHCEFDAGDSWFLVDFYSIVLHIFLEEKRQYYGLERLWAMAKRVRIPRRVKE